MTRRTPLFDPGYGLVTMAWMAGIYWLSSHADLPSIEGGPITEGALNLAHVPLFAGLALCWLKTLSRNDEVSGSWWRYGAASLASGAWAALDEWHQSFVPGREASAGDLFLDLAGIGTMILAVRVWSVHDVRTATNPP
jgi:VanZ family protein